jgi:integrase
MNALQTTKQRLVRSAKNFSHLRLYIPVKAEPAGAAADDTAAVEAAPTSKPRPRQEAAVIGVDRGVLRLQMPSHLSKQLWDKKQKYIYLGLPDTPENRLVAELVLRDIQLDIYAGCVDVTCERYVQTAEAHKPQPSKASLSFPSNLVPAFLKRETVSSLFEKYCKYKQNLLAETTLKEDYRRLRQDLAKCPQDLNDELSIQAYITANHSPYRAKRLLGTIERTIDWGKLNRVIPGSVVNVYKQYREEIPDISQREIAESIQALIQEGLIDDDASDFRAFTAEEANAIIEAFEELVCRNHYSGTPWDLVVKFLFWTGCRLGECAGLKWEQVSNDCSKITFKASYSHRSKVLRGLKTATKGKGAKSRLFPCGPKLRTLLLSIRPAAYDASAYVFTNRAGRPVNFSTFHPYWVGSKKDGIVGVLPTLIRAGKVHQYLTPYQTRHTYINIQLSAGLSPARVAKLVGNSSATIHQHYESIFRNDAPPVEF